MNLPLQLTVFLGLAAVQVTAWAYPGAGAQASEAAEVEVKHILWLHADASKENGVTAYISARLPKIKHERLSVNALRSWQMIERGEHVCRPNTIRTPQRERQAYFTDTMLAPPVELLVRRDKLNQLPRNAEGEVDLKRLLEQGRLRGAAAKGRSYGEYVDGLLSSASASAGSSKSFTLYATEGVGLRLLDMLARDRADYLIEHDGGLQQMRQRNLGAEEFTSLPIQGASEAPVAGIACPRTPWGLAAIRAIDQVIGTPAGAAELRRSTKEWLSPEAQQRMATQIKQFYQRRAQPSDPR
ncbi:TIGR02285 family protein [Paucibacter sp. KBW04]|uniref:TIGR02285 family protein n=1 Tax=Paucibacter sp. KBW04 TaxID=2153361 RepID=UPI0018CBFC24|nr:TIGR02285 family protein [Paucibacter sp. KBW04]